MNSLRLMLLTWVFLITVGVCFGQDSVSGKRYPSLVLVQLRTEQNRITALKRAKRYDDVTAVEYDAKQVMDKMHLDFYNNFNYCPVYFYIDTNADLVKARKFEGVLLDAYGVPVHNIIAPGDSNYVIAYYGYPVSQAKYHKVETHDTVLLTADELLELRAQSVPGTQMKTQAVADRDPPSGKGLVILNSDFQQLTYFYKIGYQEVAFNLKKKKLKGYYYKSKHFDIEYYPFAGLFNATMLDRYGRRRITTSGSRIKD